MSKAAGSRHAPRAQHRTTGKQPTPPSITILDAIQDQHLFAPWFRDAATWASWFVFLRALFGLAMTPDQLALFTECTGRTVAPTTPATEGWLIIGRRGGKSFVMALCAVFLACFRDYRVHLQPGERATVMVIATDRRQARVITRYVRGLLTDIPMLARLVDRESAESFDLSNHVTIEVAAASYKTTRGYTIAACLADELAFWPTEDSAQPDYEILDAIRPGMVTIPGAMLLCASSPYARRGALWDAWRKHFGRNDDPALVWKAATRTMNPTVPQSVIDAAMEVDPANAAAEYGAEFRTDIAAFIAREVIDAAIMSGRHELPPVSGTSYAAFVDPSGGSSDSFTLAIAHGGKDGRGILDVIRERRPPFSPDDVVQEFADLLKGYGIMRVSGDRYGGDWPAERFRAHGVGYEPSEKPKSSIYLELLPLMNSGRVELLDHLRLASQLCGLERRTSRGGKDSIDHAPGGHDDIANAVAGALLLASGQGSALWQREALGAAVPLPTRPDMLFAVMIVDSKSGCAGAAYFSTCNLSRPGSAICLLDCEQGPLSPALLGGVAARLLELTKTTSARREPMVFTTTELAQALERLGYRSEIIDGVVDDPMLAVSAAVHVGAGRVRIAADVLGKNYPLSFLQAAAAVQDDDDPLRLAFLAGVAVALDTNRSLGRAAA
jgi:hypothetical protein